MKSPERYPMCRSRRAFKGLLCSAAGSMACADALGPTLAFCDPSRDSSLVGSGLDGELCNSEVACFVQISFMAADGNASGDTENQLRAIVQVYHPAVLHLFSSLDRDISLAFLRDYPTPAHAARIGPARMAAFCARHGYSGRTRPELLVDRLRANLLSSADGTTDGKAFSAMLFIDQLELLNNQVRAITRRIRERLTEHPDAAIFLSFPGMGEVTAAIMLAEMGEDGARFPTADVLLAETGTAPVTRSSGRTRTVRFRYAANKRMRHAVDWWAFVAVRENDWALEAYQQARARGQLHNRALRASEPAGHASSGGAGPTTQPKIRPCTSRTSTPGRRPSPGAGAYRSRALHRPASLIAMPASTPPRIRA